MFPLELSQYKTPKGKQRILKINYHLQRMLTLPKTPLESEPPI